MWNGARQFDGIFLDFFGTIADGDRRAVEGVCARLVADLDLPLAAAALAVAWGDQFYHTIGASNGTRFRTLYECECVSLTATLETFSRRVDPAPYVAGLQDYWRRPPLHGEVHEVLAQLPVPICVVSNVDQADLEAALAAHGLDVADAVSSERARCYKPEPGIFELALERTGWARDRVLHVGDSLHSDVAGARAAGLRAAWVNRADRIYDIGTAEPDHVLEDLRGIVKIFT